MSLADADGDVAVRLQSTGSGGLCRSVLDELPEWFGLPDSVADYVAAAEPTLMAARGDADVGFLTLRLHSPDAAEIYVMGVRRAQHRHGVGRALFVASERWLAGRGVRFLQVKTLSARKRDEGYGATRAFSSALGFATLEEWPHLWDEQNPAVQLVKRISP